VMVKTGHASLWFPAYRGVVIGRRRVRWLAQRRDQFRSIERFVRDGGSLRSTSAEPHGRKWPSR